MHSDAASSSHGTISIGAPSRLGRDIAALSLVAAIFLGSLWLYTRNNDFPVEYHPDEGSKVAQLLDPAREWNFNHPLLMLEAANIVRLLSGAGDDAWEVLLAGRFTSALFGAIAAGSLALAGYVVYGLSGLILCGIIVALCPPLLVHAHYFKEDTALIAGVAIAILGAAMLLQSATRRGAVAACIVLGIGCAAGISAKYVGATLLAPCVVAIFISANRGRRQRLLQLALFLGIVTVSVLGINARMFESLAPPRLKIEAAHRISAEFEHGRTGQRDIALAVPNLYAMRMTAAQSMPHLVVLIMIGVIALALRGRPTRWGVVLAAFTGSWALVLCWNTIPFARYALPIVALVYFGAGCLASQLLSLVESAPHARFAAWGVALVAVTTPALSRCIDLNSQFRDDSRQRLREWIARNTPAHAKVIADGYAALSSAGDARRFPEQSRLTQAVVARLFAADAMEPDASYVVTALPSYERFFVPGVYATLGTDALLEQRRQFYARLTREGRLVWSSESATPSYSYVNPGIRVYRIKPGAE